MSRLDAIFRSVDLNERFSFIRGAKLRELLTQPKVLDALVKRLDTAAAGQGAAHVRRMTPDEKLDAIFSTAKFRSGDPNSYWHGNGELTIVSAALWDSEPDLPGKLIDEIFSNVAKESSLQAPVATWLKSLGYEVYAEVPMGRNRADVVGFKAGGFPQFLYPTEVVAVELKDDIREAKRAFDQLTSYKMFSTRTYFACTPYIAAAYSHDVAESLRPSRYSTRPLRDKVAAATSGLLIVEGPHVDIDGEAPRSGLDDQQIEAVKKLFGRCQRL